MNDPFERGEEREAQARALMQELRAELALQRKALELVVDRITDIPEPIDYSRDIGGLSKLTAKIAESLAVIKSSPAMAEDGTQIVARIDKAARNVVYKMEREHREATEELRETRNWLLLALKKDRSAKEQDDAIVTSTLMGIGGGVLIMLVLLAILPPSFAVAPYNMFRDDTRWDIGWNLKGAAEPQATRDLLSAWVIWKNNSDAIRKCQEYAKKQNSNVKCEIVVKK